MLFGGEFNNLAFLSLFYVGCISGILYEITVFLCKITNSKLFLRNILDIFVVLFGGILFIFAINYIAMGKFRVYLLLAFGLGIVIERTSIGFLVAKICDFVYNKGIKKLFFIRRKHIDSRKTKDNS